jgi:hypothetical protein
MVTQGSQSRYADFLKMNRGAASWAPSLGDERRRSSQRPEGSCLAGRASSSFKLAHCRLGDRAAADTDELVELFPILLKRFA